ncbi:MAG: hypothetical protein HOK17_09015 [Flammeovirgaceae bacterium]|nr:hypothetical protein [Flammeovirgaceae bacterium]
MGPFSAALDQDAVVDKNTLDSAKTALNQFSTIGMVQWMRGRNIAL